MASIIQIIYAKNPGELINRRSALGSYIFTLAGLLSQAGHRVRLNDFYYQDLIDRLDKDESQTPPSSRSLPLPLPKKLKAIARDILLFRNHRDLLDKVKILPKVDSILEFYTYGSDVGLKLSRLSGADLHLVYDGPVVEEYEIFQDHKPPFLNKIQKNQIESLRHATGIVAYSNPMKEYICQLADLKVGFNIHIHQNIDFSRFEFYERKDFNPPHVIGFVGSFLKWHRVDLLVEVFERLREEGHDLKLLLVGQGMEYDNITQQVSASSWKENIEMTGFLDKEELSEAKKRMHIGVMSSSNWYGAPNKLFEYGAMSIACVAPRTPTIADIFSEELIPMFPNYDREGLYAAIKSLLMEEGIIREKAKKLYQMIRGNFGEEKTRGFYERFLLGQEEKSESINL